MLLKGNGIMNSTYKMFAVNEKIILYILFLIVLQFFYIFPTALYADFYRFVSPCDRWQSAYFDYIPFFVVGVGGPRIQGHNVTSLWAGTCRVALHYTGGFDTWSRENYVYFLKSNTSEENRQTSLFSALTCVNTEATGLLK